MSKFDLPVLLEKQTNNDVFNEDFENYVVSSYLFNGDDVIKIESDFSQIGITQDGTLANRVLRHFCISANGRGSVNKGLYKGKDVNEVANYLIAQNDARLVDIANILLKKKIKKIVDSKINIPKRKNRTYKDIDLNTILYGAPGTGKTYSAPEYAVAIVENKSYEQIVNEYKNNRTSLVNKYNSYIEAGRIVFTTFHQNYGYEDFIQGLRPDIESDDIKFNKVDGLFKTFADKALNSDDNFVIIIDEINRGNISKIFGELITLIEDDKRWGENEQMYLTLPSGDKFTVPNNLYILGTMNSADKSISLVDAALRRRFKFIEKSPDSSLVNVEFRKFLDQLNGYLSKELNSKDLLIGHSYFIGKNVKDFADIVNQNIVPLLYEYFFDDEKKVKKAILDASAPVLYKDDKGTEFVFEVIENPTSRVKYQVVKRKAA